MISALNELTALVKSAPRMRRPFVLGLCGAQGSGKSTIADALAQALIASGRVTAVLSLDDLYLRRGDRLRRAAVDHPLFATRGVPGTHDLALANATFRDLDAGRATRLPRFAKAIDDRAAATSFPEAPAGLDVLIFEGWCVGARPEPAGALDTAVNALEQEEDGDSSWRRAVNDALAGPYAALFERIDRLALLAAPSFEIVATWREQQEQALRRAAGADAGMIPSQVARFVMFYERITRHILREMPARADLTLRLAADRSVVGLLRSGQPG